MHLTGALSTAVCGVWTFEFAVVCRICDFEGVAGAGGALYLTGALSTAVRDCPKPILCEPGAFCERRNRRSQLGAKVENPQPPQVQQSVRFGGTWGERNFFWGGRLRKTAQGDFGTWRVFLKLFQKIICRLRGPWRVCG